MAPSTERGTDLPPSTARERPEARTVRERNSSPSSGSRPRHGPWPRPRQHPVNHCPHRQNRHPLVSPECSDATASSESAKIAWAQASSAPAETREDSAAPPETSRIAESSMDLPAPVSPVMAVMPAAGAMVASRIGPDCGYRVLRASGSCLAVTFARLVGLGTSDASVTGNGNASRIRGRRERVPVMQRLARGLVARVLAPTDHGRSNLETRRLVNGTPESRARRKVSRDSRTMTRVPAAGRADGVHRSKSSLRTWNRPEYRW